MLWTILFLFLAGIAGGFIAGLAGIGGGIVYIFIIPIALDYYGVPLAEVPQFTIANSLFAIFFASLAGNIVRYKNKELYFKEIVITGIAGVVSSLLVLEFIVNTPAYSIGIFNIILLVLLLYLLLSTISGAKKNYSNPPENVGKGWLGSVGATGGVISALSGMGGGIIIIPLLNSIFKIDIKKAGSVSLGVITMMAFTMTVFNLFEDPASAISSYNSGYIIFPVAVPLVAGVLLGSPYGSVSARKLKSSVVSYIYAGFLLIVIIRKIMELVKYYNLWPSS